MASSTIERRIVTNGLVFKIEMRAVSTGVSSPWTPYSAEYWSKEEALAALQTMNARDAEVWDVVDV